MWLSPERVAVLQCFAAPPVSSPEVDDNQTKDDTPQVNDDAAQTCSGGSGTCTDEACSDEACATTTAVIENRESNPSPGDALFVPTWTWHRVDYTTATYAGETDDDSSGRKKEPSNNTNDDGNNVSIGASLFHFRVGDYVRRNPLFALLLVPAIVKEAMGISSQ